MNYQEQAEIIYKNHPKLEKARAAGKQLDNSLLKDYGPEGSTDCHFRIDQYLKYFSYESIKNLT